MAEKLPSGFGVIGCASSQLSAAKWRMMCGFSSSPVSRRIKLQNCVDHVVMRFACPVLLTNRTDEGCAAKTRPEDAHIAIEHRAGLFSELAVDVLIVLDLVSGDRDEPLARPFPTGRWKWRSRSRYAMFFMRSGSSSSTARTAASCTSRASLKVGFATPA